MLMIDGQWQIAINFEFVTVYQVYEKLLLTAPVCTCVFIMYVL